MTSLLVAKYGDDRLTTWDTRVIDLWPDFVAPTSRLTSSLTVHPLLGMGSGIAEPETIEYFASDGAADAEQLLRTIPYLKVIAGDKREYFSNNTLVAAAPFLVMLADGTAAAEREERYAPDLAAAVFRPIGMDDAVVSADPRPFGPDYATGYQRNLFQEPVRVPFVSIGGYGPAGFVLASGTDMARYLITQSTLDIPPDGIRVVSAENMRRTHQPKIVVPPDSLNGLPSVLLVDTTRTNYDLGWFDEVFGNGKRMRWHGDGIDGFGSLMGFLPEHGLGFVALTNYEPAIGGLLNFAVQSAFLQLLFGLNGDIPALLATIPPTAAAQQRDALAATKNPSEVAAGRDYRSHTSFSIVGYRSSR